MSSKRESTPGSLRGRWNLWDWMVAGWVIFLDWLFDLAQWALSNIVPQFKNGTLQGTLWAGLAFGCLTLLIRVIRNNEQEQRAVVFPLTPPQSGTNAPSKQHTETLEAKQEKE